MRCNPQESLKANALIVAFRGFRMLAAMGYQPGQGIGKGHTGRAVPVPVEVKGGRQGLGVDENRKRRKVQAEEQRKQRGSSTVLVCTQCVSDLACTNWHTIWRSN